VFAALAKGDLVKIMQGSFMYPLDTKPWLAKRTRQPEYGVVLAICNDEETAVFVGDDRWKIKNKYIQLIGEEDVYKITKDSEKPEG
jgi:hypothetical protein